MSLEIKDLTVHAGDFSLAGISMNLLSGECAVIMGRSGAGKTTLMEALCGLRKVGPGEIFIDGKRVDSLRPGEREIGLVPQDAALFPHMTVRQHLEFALRLRKWGKVDSKNRIEYLVESLKLSNLLNRKPLNLSGGESKRVAIARAIAPKPKLLCLDEAFTGLDDESSMAILTHLKAMISEGKITTLNITHRHDEAALLGGKGYQLSEAGLNLESL